MSIGKHLRSERRSYQMTLKELSTRTGLSIPYLSDVERDKCNPSISSIKKIAEAYHCTLHRLFEFYEENEQWKKQICLNFDGAIHSFVTEWDRDVTYTPDPPVKGVFDALEGYIRHFKVCVYSTRSTSDLGREAMRKYIDEHFKIWSNYAPATSIVCHIYFPISFPQESYFIDKYVLKHFGRFPEVDYIKEMME